MTAINDVIAERARQDAKWGGPTHDDEHDVGDWNDWIQGRLDDAAGTGDSDERRKLLVEIGALAVAAIESHDRIEARRYGRQAAPTTTYMVISCDNLDREGPNHDDVIIAQGIEDLELAGVMCTALNDAHVGVIVGEQDGEPLMERYHRVVPSSHKLKVFRP